MIILLKGAILMKITIIGSYRVINKKSLKHNKQDFEKACFEIGRKLADWGHKLVLPNPNKKNTAERHTLKGFKSVKSSEYRYYECTNYPTDPVLKAHFDAVENSDAVILIGGHGATYASGLFALRRRKLVIPITCFGGSAEALCRIAEIDKIPSDKIRNLEIDGEKSKVWVGILTSEINSILKAFPRILIIHGRGDSGEDLKKKIFDSSHKKNSKIHGIAEPLIMDLKGKGAVSVPDIFEEHASEVSAAIAIVTADDIGGFARRSIDKDYSAKELNLQPRARENVWVEVGWFWGRLGRQRVFLWLKDEDLRLPSDLQGAAWTRSDSLNGAWKSIEAFIESLRKGND